MNRKINFLKKVKPIKLQEYSENKLLKTFYYASKKSTFYSSILKEKNILPDKIKSMDDFKQYVPLMDKKILFQDNELIDVCFRNDISRIHYLWSSSGTSNIFSFGMDTKRGFEKSSFIMEFLYRLIFNSFNKKILFINGNGMGVQLPTIRIPVAQTGTRSDAVIAILKKYNHYFDGFVIIGNSLFIKEVVEEGIDNNLDWSKLMVHVVTGGEFISESYRNYIANLLGIDSERPETGQIVLNMGLSEVANTIFFDTHHLRSLRKEIYKNKKLINILCGSNTKACPEIMHYLPQYTYLETIKNNEAISNLIITLLSMNRMIPIIRYRTSDMIELYKYEDFVSLINKNNIKCLKPDFHLPVALVWGKEQRLELKENCWISPNEIKDILYNNYDTVYKLTGNFRIYISKKNVLTLLIQVKNNRECSTIDENNLKEALDYYIHEPVKIQFINYTDFPFGMNQNFERKNNYVLSG